MNQAVFLSHRACSQKSKIFWDVCVEVGRSLQKPWFRKIMFSNHIRFKYVGEHIHTLGNVVCIYLTRTEKKIKFI